MVEEHQAIGFGAGFVEDDVFAEGELPFGGEVCVGGGCQGFAGFGSSGVEFCEHGFAGAEG